MNLLVRCLCLSSVATLILSTAAAAADNPPRNQSEQAYDKAQGMRNEARKQAASGSNEGLKAGAETLEAAIAFLNQPDTRELSLGSRFLYFRGHDVRLDLAGLYAKLGEKELALQTLRGALQFAWLPHVGDMLKKAPEFSALREDPRFQKIMAIENSPASLWKSPAIETGYKEKLTAAERVAGLSLFWAEARQHFVHFDKLDNFDWNAIYLDYLQKVMSVESTRDYYAIMMQLAPLLKDGHTNIYAPKELQDEFYARPPMRTGLIEGRVWVTSVNSPTLARQVRVGDEITAIDGLPVHEYAKKNVQPFVSSSTPQDQQLRMYSYQLLSGSASRPLQLSLKDAKGLERKEVVARTGYNDVANVKSTEFRMLPGNVAYLSLGHFESDEGVKLMEQSLPQILEAQALIIDVRRNGGGSTQHGWNVLSYLTRSPIPGAHAFERADVASNRRLGVVVWQELSGNGRKFSVDRPRIFEGPVAVLTGPQTFSAAEDFLVSFKLLKRGLIVGEASGGSTGQPLSFNLPGGGSARICAKRDVFPDGTEFVGIGIQPDIPAHMTISAFHAGTDPTIEAAQAALLAGQTKRP